MKKLLALVLALVMTLSLATVSTSAAYEDAADISYVEAAEVMSEVGVFVGDGKNFAPKAALNREQAAKLVAYLALGEDVAEALPAVAMFDDVAASSWAAKYIAYCADAGIITGDGAGKFFPTAPVDGYAFAKMLLCALGYSAQAEGYVGSAWSINVARDAKALDLTKGFAGDLSKNLTREEAAQLMMRAIMCQVVDKYEGAGSSITIGDVTISGDYGTAKLGGYYYATELDSVAFYETAVDHDEYGRNGRQWVIGTDFDKTYALRAPKFTFTAKTSESAMATALKGYYVHSNDYKVAKDTAYSTTLPVEGATNGVDGAHSLVVSSSVSTAAALAGLTANGKVVEMYADSDKVIDEIVVIDYTLGQIYDVKVDKKTGYESYQLVAGGAYYSADPDATSKAVLNGAMAEEDYVTYVALGANKVVFYPTTMVKGTITAFDADAGTYTFNGDAVKVGEVNDSALGLNSTEAKYFFDQYGYMVKTSSIGMASNFAFVVAAYGKTTTDINGEVPSIQVKAVLADGTVGVYDVKLDKKTESGTSNYYFSGTDTKITTVATDAASLLNNVFKYELTGNTIKLGFMAKPTSIGASGTYAADYIVEADAIDNKDTTVQVAYTAGSDTEMLLNSKTTFVAYDADKGTAKVMVGNGSISGYQFDYATASDVVFTYDADADTFVVKYVFSADYNTSTEVVDAYGYINEEKFVQTKDGDDVYYAYTMTLVDGSTITVKAKNTAISGSGLYKYNTDFTVVEGSSEYAGATVIAKTAANVVDTLVELGGNYYNMVDDTKIVDVSDDYDAVDDAQVIAVLKTKDGAPTKDLAALFIVNA